MVPKSDMTESAPRTGPSVSNGSPTRRLLGSVAAAGVMILLVHQPLVWVLHANGVVPWLGFDRTPIGPFGVPSVVNAVFWGALWGPVIERAGRGTRRSHLRAAIAGAAMTTLVGGVLLAMGHGAPLNRSAYPMLTFWSLLINGCWSCATSIAIGRLVDVGMTTSRDT